MLVLSSPSGAGKSTIARNLLEDKDLSLSLSVSVTTRERRPSEIEGVHYKFVAMREFERLRDSDMLLEWAEVHGNCYATPREPVEMAMGEGRDMLFDIDWQGAEQLREKIPADVVSVFILPPSMAELKARLKRRAEDSDDVIERRLQNARLEMEHWRDYDYVVINEDLDRAFAEVKAIVTAERLRRDRRPGLFDFVSGLLDERTS
ncbi:MAG: guanylate kinase [Rhizobiaceae bacterium]